MQEMIALVFKNNQSLISQILYGFNILLFSAFHLPIMFMFIFQEINEKKLGKRNDQQKDIRRRWKKPKMTLLRYVILRRLRERDGKNEVERYWGAISNY